MASQSIPTPVSSEPCPKNSIYFYAKRVTDIGICFFGGLMTAPVIVLLALLVRLDSPGPAFYTQLRVGQGGRLFRLWKFRTMYQNASALLAEHLSANPNLQIEWQHTQKLKNDPRMTRVGSFLRRFSLDELPQLWNILRGEMSLIGPRPCTEDQIPLYGEAFGLYTHVRPGLSGLWQVSGRNNLTFEQRVQLDVQYIRDCSPWLDTWILFKTIWAVLRHDGAY
jgi:Undecaprenyl-phosphate galactose phosphotransferase WbaP